MKNPKIIIFDIIFGYGEKPSRILIWIIIFILYYATVYYRLKCIFLYGSKFQRLITCFYFSAVTFTTLGFGDLKPNTNYGRIITISESILGIVLNAIFVATRARIVIRI